MWFDKLTTNGINKLPFVLSLSKDLIRGSLTYQAEKFGHHPEVILAGRRINDGMGKYIAEQTMKNMVKTRGSLNGGVVNVLGLTFVNEMASIAKSRRHCPGSSASRIPRHAG